MKSLLISLFALLLVSDVELGKRKLLDNKIEMLVPVAFKDMPPEIVNIKYPGKNRPKLILSNEAATTNLAFTLSDNRADSSVINVYHEMIIGTFKKNQPEARWIDHGVKQINGKKVGYLKLVTPGIDQKIYNYLFLTDVDKKLLIGTFNCLEKEMPEWVSVADEIVASLTVAK